jgi:hypothetical protein
MLCFGRLPHGLCRNQPGDWVAMACRIGQQRRVGAIQSQPPTVLFRIERRSVELRMRIICVAAVEYLNVQSRTRFRSGTLSWVFS